MSSVDTIAKIEASLDNGGWSATGAVFNDADRIDFYQALNAHFRLYAGGGWEGLLRPAFRGHLVPDPWQKIFQSSNAPFKAKLANEIMKAGEVQGIYFKSVASAPANRHQIINMSYAKIIYEIISGHCNLMHSSEAANYDSSLWSGAFTTQTFDEGFLFLDLNLTNSSLVGQYTVRQGGFWSKLSEIADIDNYLLYVDKTNTLHAIPHPMFNASLASSVLTITSGLLLEPLTIERRYQTVGQVRISGSTPDGTQISGKYPDDPQPGPVLQKTGYMAASNAAMTAIATRIYKYQNRDSVVTAVLPGAVGLLLELVDRVAITYTSTVDGMAWSAKKFWISDISVAVKSNFTATTTLKLDAENI